MFLEIRTKKDPNSLRCPVPTGARVRIDARGRRSGSFWPNGDFAGTGSRLPPLPPPHFPSAQSRTRPAISCSRRNFEAQRTTLLLVPSMLRAMAAT